MVQKKGRKKLFTALAVIGALLLIVAVVSVVKAMSNNEPSVPTQTSAQDTPSVSDADESNSTDQPATTEPVAEQPAIDPETVATVAIEPMTAAPDALNNGKGLRWLAPGETMTARWGVRYER